MAAPALLLAAALLASASSHAYRAPRTPDGQPNLQGDWTNATLTPLQRDEEFAGLIAKPAEIAAWLDESGDAAKDAPPPPKENWGASFWFEPGRTLLTLDGKPHSSVITDPADGKLPYSASGKRQLAEAVRRDKEAFDGPEDRSADERCLMAVSSSVGPPMLPPPYNAHYRFVQTPGFVAISAEMIHDVRVIRLAGPHEAGAPKWLGDSIGHWEGETLVVETVNQHPLTALRFAAGGVLYLTPHARMTERFIRTSPTEIRYAFTVDDPAVYGRAWSGELAFHPNSQPAYEYACHEGNYALANILRTAREKERLDAETAKPGPPARGPGQAAGGPT